MRVNLGYVLVATCLLGLAQGQRLRGRLTSRTFQRDMSTVPPGAATLAFVFDVTGSMWDDLKQVIAGARKILSTTLSRREQPLYDYVLIPFHDPVVGPITVTTDGDRFERSLKNLYVHGGGDCPEMSLTAIREALEISLPSSFIYVFTDASAKDYNFINDVLRIIQRKQSQVVFVLTGDCNNRNSKGYRAYEKIAATSSGQVFFITKSDVSEVVKFIEVSVQAHKVVLHATDHTSPGDRTWRIPFDPELREVTLSLSGPDRRIRLFNPEGREVTQRDGLETLLELDSVLILNIKNATPGNWRVSAYSSGAHSFRVTGLSTLDFQARFSRKATLDWNNADYQPVEGADAYVLLNATGLPPPGEFRNMILRDTEGITMNNIPLDPPPDLDQPYLYAARPFPTPKQDFYIYVSGVTHEGFPFTRATKNAILKIIPTAPRVTMPRTHPGYFDYPAEIPCKVESLLPYNVTWSRQLATGWQMLTRSHHEEGGTVYYRIDEVTEEAEGIYKCYVVNSMGQDYGRTFLDVEELPPGIRVDGNVTVEPGGRAILTCHITSKITYTVSWSRVDGTLLDRSRTRLLSNYSLVLSRARPEDEAAYRCTATNKGGSSQEDLHVFVQSKPRVKVFPSEPIGYTANMTISLRCSVHGYPEPTIVWLKGEDVVRPSDTIRIRRRNTELRFTKAQQVHEGVYTCQATNKAGSDSASGRLVFNESPTATLGDDQFVLEGVSTFFECHVTGIPKPRILWYKGEHQVASGQRYQISDEEGTLAITGLLPSDSGEYTCLARNDVGRASDVVYLRVGTIPVIIRPPVNTGIDIDRGGYLTCDARGFPPPEITWLKRERHVESGRGDSQVVGVLELVIGKDDTRLYHETPSNNLVIRDMGLDDVGDYICTATNQFGSDSESARVDVTGLVRPLITVSDKNFHVIVGQSIDLPCRITSGNPAPGREWQREGSVFEPTGRVSINDDGSVVITSARVSDAGQYVCVATNVAGQFDLEMELDVWVPPTITTPESDYTTIEERAVYLLCDTTGNPSPTVQWTKEGIHGPLRYLPDYRVLADNRLLISNPKAEDSGRYTCTAINPAGRVSVDGHLVVYYKPRTKDGSSDTYTVIEGDSITLDCPVTESNPPPTFTWRFGGEEIIHITGRYELSDDGKLKIVSAQVKDDGQYTCTAVNEAGSVTHDMSLVVYVPPRILKGPSIIRGLEGEDISLKCEATGIPLPEIRWRRNDLEVVGTARISIEASQTEYSSSSVILIHPARLSDDGEFVCVAQNVAGKDTSSTTLDVQQRPTIERNNFNNDLTPSRGSQLSIPCVAHGDPNPTIRWFHNGQELTGDELDVDIASNGSLILYSVESEDSGMYRCEAENPLGTVDIEARVTVYEPPEIDGEGKTTRIWVYEGDPATMHCHADAVPKPQIRWYKVERTSDRLLKAERNHVRILLDGEILNITRSRVSDTGRYYCAATNVEGTSYKFYELDVYVLPSIDGSDETGRSKVVLGDDFTLECPASGIPFPRIRWFKGPREISVEDEGMLIDNRGQRLTVLDSELKHDGEYTCVADNQVGDASKLFDVSVLVPPQIEGDNMIHTVQVTRYLAMECRASGIPKPTLSWYKDDKAVAISNSDLLDGPRTLENGRYLEFASMRVEDEGVYKCVAVNEAGSDNKNHTVNVQVPPELGDHDAPANISVVKGDDITLTCHATGDPPPTITWLKDGVVIRSGRRYTITGHGAYLTIQDAIESDRGKYTCQASNDVGIVTQNQYLDVLVGADISGPDEEILTAKKGDTVALDCVVTGNPTPRIRWEKNGRLLSANEHYRFDYEGQRLIISNVDETDTSQYTCTASNIIDDDSKAFRLDVHVPPEIEPFKKDIYEVVEGEKVSITCVATGIPAPVISWLKGDQEISKSRFFKFRDGGSQLVILKADVPVHDGQYTCRATNVVGEDEKDVGVSVLIPPSIYGQHSVVNEVVTEGDGVTFECQVKSGKPEPVVRWFRGHDNLISRLSTVWNYNIAEETLNNLRTHVDNTGGYWCEASNIAGKARKNFTLDVQVMPFIEGDKIQSKHVILNNDISFPCEVSGVPMPDVTWTKDGNPISVDLAEKYRQTREGFGKYYLTVINAQEEDRGLYTCIAENPAGSDEKNVDLDVYLPPSYDGKSLINVTALEDEDVFLECDIEAFPQPTIRWYKDGRPIVLPREVEESRETDSILPIPRAQLSDTGIYRCEAENVAGTIDRGFRLNVHSAPKVFGPLVDEITKLVGDQIDMVCDIRGVPPPTLSWTKNGHPLKVDESKMTLLSGSKVLRIYNAELADTGQFECHGTNEEGTATKSFDVTIHESSRIHGSPHELHDINKGDDFVLECFVSGTPRPTIRWFKDGEEIFDGFRTLISEGGRYLAMSDAHEHDEGHYTCNASNVESYDTKAFTVNILVPPTIHEGPDRLWVKEGNNIVLMCNVQSNSPVEITWSHNGVPLVPSTYVKPSPQGKRLHLFEVQRSKAGQYTCTATNAAGTADRHTMLDVYIPPLITDGDTTDVYNVTKTESVTLECDVTGFPEPTIEWSKDFYPITFDDEGRAQHGNYEIDESGHFLTLFDAEVYNEGMYKCHATNDAGYADKNYRVNVFVPPEIYRDGLTDEIITRERSFVRIQCSASGLPTPTIRWLKNGYALESTDAVTITNHFEDHHSFLAFKSITEDDGATYTCIAENPAGQDAFDIDINVNVPPKIRGSENFGATNVEVIAGDTLDLECEVIRGTPKPEIEWWKRSRKIMSSERVKILGGGRYLRIPQARLDDYGVYTCIAKNVEGADSKEFNVQTLEPPRFPDGDIMDDIDVILGFSHYITCDIDAQPQPQINWFKDGQPIETDSNVKVGHNGRVLLIRSARLQDGGIYTCRARNKAGSDDKRTRVRILTPPSIQDNGDDNDVNVELGRPTYLNCTVDGYPQPNVTWFRNGIKVNLREQNFKTYDDGQILSIGAARLIDSGRYDCHASNTAGRDRKDFRLTVQVAPTIAGPNYEDVTLLEGRYYELDCFSSGIPDPDNRWFKDSVPVRQGQRYSQFREGHTLGIYKANEEDAGMFICEAGNVVGTARKTFNVTVHMSPRLDDSSKFKDLVVNQGDDITLDCRSQTFPKPTVIWIKNGEEVSPRIYATSEGRRIQISNDGFLLKIYDATPEDAAQYSCELANDAGATSRNFHLTVNTPPEIEGPERENIVKPIDSIISMDCSVQGSPTPEVQWFKDKKPIRLSQRVHLLPGLNTLRIDRALEKDMGVYSCIASNIAGSDKKDFDVEILVRPSIDKTTGPDNLESILGDEVLLACPITASNPPATVTWFKDGLRVVPGHAQVLESGQMLVLPSAELDDAGSYTCVAKNSVGQDDRSFGLKILVPPAVGFRNSPNHVEVNEMFDAVLECDIVGGQPPPQITWTHNGEPLQMTQRVRTFAEGRRLEIRRSLVSDTGDYKCTAVNPAGTVSDNVRLDVYVPPAFTNPGPEDIVLIEGETLDLDCTVHGVPEPELAWTKSEFGEEAYPLFEGDRVQFAEDHQSARIEEVLFSDTGLFSCVASSIAGQAQKLFNVSVQIPPTIDAPLETKKVTVVEGRSFDLNCPVIGIPVPEVTWLKNGRPLPTLDASRIRNDGQQLHIESSRLSDIGTYTCEATSDAGKDSRKFDVDVIVPPSALTDQLEITAVTGSNVKLECKSDAIPPPTFSWFKDDRPIGHYGNLLLLKNVQIGNTGVYSCEATNDAGTAVQETKLIVLKKPEIARGPDALTALLHETVKILCMVDGVPKPEVSWWKDSQELSPDTDNRYRRIGDALEVQDLQLDDSGDYKCLATNDAGSDQQITNLRVLDAPTIGRGATNITAIANQPVTLPCDASGTPQPVVRWMKDSRPYYTSHRLGYRQEERGSMHISSVSSEDTGLYTCTAVNEAGSADRDIQLFVQVPPSIASALSEYIVEPFTRLRIPCDVSGIPMPTARWTREGIDADQLIGVYVNPRDNSLDIPSVGTLHEGVYRCTAENPAGQAHYDATVRVRTPPVVNNPKQTVEALEGTTATLPCDATGTPEPIVTWRRGSQIIDVEESRFSLDDDNSLRIRDVEVDDVAAYTCVAQNIAGTAFGQVQLDVHVLPRIESDLQPREVAIAGQPFSFSIKASGIPEPDVSWSKNGYDLDGIGDSSHYLKQDDGSLHIPIVLPSDTGLYNVTASNLAGISWMLTQLDVIVPPEIRAVAPNVTIIQGGQIPLDIVVDGDPAPVITWTKDGEPISNDDERIRQLSYGSLIINNAMSTDTGHYVATGINAAGRDSAEIMVVVQVPPTFTETPRDQQRQSGEDMILRCAAVGYPTPIITWEFGGALIAGSNDGSGTSELTITNVRGQDAGIYTCKATNPAGVIVSIASVSVDSPPVFTSEHDPNVIGKLGETARIDCAVAANPIPTITWTKDGRRLVIGRRFQQLANGSLLIYNTIEEDAGDYKCIATNEAGSVARVTKLTLKIAPKFLKTPSDTTAVSGTSVLFDCSASGVPTPRIEWRRSSRPIPLDGRFKVLRNHSLQIAGVQLGDTGEFECIATNEIGSRMAKGFLTVKVHGKYGDWGAFGSCSSTCGEGTQRRIRFCNSPPPANGGNDCAGPDEDTRACQQGYCPVNGKWSEFGSWETCSVTCGQGTETRTRECNNPPAQYGGAPCSGDGFEKRLCSGPKCAINGKWSNWGVWQQCSASCGEGVSVRTRACNNPAPSVGGENCPGSDTESRVCNLKACPVRGNWAEWGPFSVCSVSCGGGTRDRIRTCSNPPPTYGGELCPGSNVQIDNCNPEPCPVNGNWADWALWSSCSRSCGGGQRRRYRVCSQPRPRYGGRYCPGTDTLMQSCGLIPCPEDGGWSEWTEWTPCGVTCGAGTRTRQRSCTNPPPRHNGKTCEGDSTQVDQCALHLCPGGPRDAIGTIFGNVNDIPISGSSVVSHGIPIGDDKMRVVSVIKDIPKALGPDLRNQVSILTPIYWTFAREIEGAYNGHTLTGGNFERLVNVEFPSGELVEMHHDARGVDKDGNLVVDIEINGNVPMFPPTIELSIMDYFEEYLQTGPDNLYAYSDRFYAINGEIMLYTWNHTIYYDESHGVMPYLVEQLFGTNVIAEYDPDTLELKFQIDVTIGKGDPSNACPYGFLLDETGQYCTDEDECSTQEPCSDVCVNLMGSYTCDCPQGFHVGMDGDTCEDIDECEENESDCEAPFICQNTRGSYKCIVTCGSGLETTLDGQACQDINECETSGERICEHICNNTYGSFRCSCRPGYQRVFETQCEDIDECTRGACHGDIRQCHNTPGSYFCTNTCPTGFSLDTESGLCVDDNECADDDDLCQHACENVAGSYRCTCYDGFKMNSDTGLCEDLDECQNGKGPCQYGCKNLDGDYKCYCPEGYRLVDNGHSCEDINECLEGSTKCAGRDLMCANSLGSFRCVSIGCPIFYSMKDGVCTKDCDGDDCLLSVYRYNSTFLRAGVPENQDLLELAVSYTTTDGDLALHGRTDFRVVTPQYDRAYRLFGLRVVGGQRGIIYTKRAITRQFIDWYKLTVRATSTSADGVQYETTFGLYINVAPNPFA